MPDLSKSKDVSLETEQDEKPLKKAVFVRVTAKNLTTLDTIGLAVLIMFQPVLNLGRLIDEDNHRRKLAEEREIVDKQVRL